MLAHASQCLSLPAAEAQPESRLAPSLQRASWQGLENKAQSNVPHGRGWMTEFFC